MPTEVITRSLSCWPEAGTIMSSTAPPAAAALLLVASAWR